MQQCTLRAVSEALVGEINPPPQYPARKILTKIFPTETRGGLVRGVNPPHPPPMGFPVFLYSPGYATFGRRRDADAAVPALLLSAPHTAVPTSGALCKKLRSLFFAQAIRLVYPHWDFS